MSALKQLFYLLTCVRAIPTLSVSMVRELLSVSVCLGTPAMKMELVKVRYHLFILQSVMKQSKIILNYRIEECGSAPSGCDTAHNK